MDITNAGQLKIALLVQGMQLEESAKQSLEEKWQEKIYSYSLADWVDKKIVLPSDIKLDERVYVGFRFNPDSPWRLVGDDNGRRVISKGELEIKAALIPRPSYYDRLTSRGERMQSIGVSCGNHGVSFFLNSYCEYFKDGRNCRFCSLVPTQKKFSDTVKRKTVEQVRETTQAILDLGCKLDFIQLSGGSLYDHNKENRDYMPFILAIHEELAKRELVRAIPVHLTSMPPKNLDILLELRDAGLDTISFDLECPTQSYFERYCPGKSRTQGYRNMRKALTAAQDVFGRGNVFSIIILGIEPRKSFVNGVEDLLKDGITPTLNIYHHDPFCSTDSDLKVPDVEETIQTAKDIGALFRQYKAVPGNLGCAHYDIGHEIAKGDI